MPSDERATVQYKIREEVNGLGQHRFAVVQYIEQGDDYYEDVLWRYRRRKAAKAEIVSLLMEQAARDWRPVDQ